MENEEAPAVTGKTWSAKMRRRDEILLFTSGE